MALKTPYLLFLGDPADELPAKTATGVAYWRPEWCVGQLRLRGCQARLDLPELSIAEAVAQGARTMVIGVVNAGGILADTWIESLEEALTAGLDVASGLHVRLADVPALKQAADANGRDLVDARHPTRAFAVGTGTKRPGKRLLSVGTDCSVGKMYASLAIEREMRARGMDADFRATGQTGIFIAGDGVSVDAVVADFISGATEWLAPENGDAHWDLIEGQGSLFHPSYAGVSLGLLHGSQPDAMVLCHEPTRTHMRGLPSKPLPDLAACIAANEEAARLTNAEARCVGVCVNTSEMAPGEAGPYLEGLEADLGIPCTDPVASGVGRIVDSLAS